MYFAIDSYGNMELFDTEQEAIDEADKYLQAERNEAGDGWSEEVHRIMWGKVLGKIEETMRRPRTEDDYYISKEFDTVVDYDVVRIKGSEDAS